MNLVDYIAKYAMIIEDEFTLSRVGENKKVIGLDAATLEDILDDFICNEIESKGAVLGLLPTYSGGIWERLCEDAEEQGIYPYPEGVGVDVEIVETYDESKDNVDIRTYIQLEPLYTAQALNHFNVLPHGDFDDDDLVATQFGGNREKRENTEILLEMLLGNVTESKDRGSDYMAELLSRVIGTPVESQGYLSTDIEGSSTLALFSLPDDAFMRK